MMNNEEFDRKAAFIVNQQAKFAVDIDRLGEKQAKTEEAIDRLVARQAQTDEAIDRLAAKQAINEEAINRLIATQAKTEEVVTRLAYVTNVGFKDVNAKIDALVNSQIALTESQKQTDEGLRKLTITVDRYLSRRGNGG